MAEDGRRGLPYPCPMLNVRSETAMRVLIAIEPRAYSQTIGYTVRALRPRYAVEVLDPDLLGAEVERHPPTWCCAACPGQSLRAKGPRGCSSVLTRHQGSRSPSTTATWDWRACCSTTCCPSSTRRSPCAAAPDLATGILSKSLRTDPTDETVPATRNTHIWGLSPDACYITYTMHR